MDPKQDHNQAGKTPNSVVPQQCLGLYFERAQPLQFSCLQTCILGQNHFLYTVLQHLQISTATQASLWQPNTMTSYSLLAVTPALPGFSFPSENVEAEPMTTSLSYLSCFQNHEDISYHLGWILTPLNYTSNSFCIMLLSKIGRFLRPFHFKSLFKWVCYCTAPVQSWRSLLNSANLFKNHSLFLAIT